MEQNSYRDRRRWGSFGHGRRRPGFFGYAKTPWILGFLILCMFAWYFFLYGKGERTFEAWVVSVHDGDTFKANIPALGEEKVTVRIKDLDCFELPSATSSKQVARQKRRFGISTDEVYKRGEKALEIAQNLFSKKENKVQLIINQKHSKDMYGRFLARVYVGEENIATLLKATPYCFEYRDPRLFSSF